VAGCYLGELHARGEPELGVNVREVVLADGNYSNARHSSAQGRGRAQVDHRSRRSQAIITGR
jgi:hypothetical protein